MDNDHSITDELRSFTKDPLLGYASQEQHVEQLTAIADRIDAALAERYVELPKDADGEYIHVGDMMGHRVFPDAKYTVIGIGENAFFTCDASGELYKHIASLYPHYKQPTVEDVLRDMHAKLDEVTALYVGEAIDSDERDSEEARIFAEYVAKLQLRGDAE